MVSKDYFKEKCSEIGGTIMFGNTCVSYAKFENKLHQNVERVIDIKEVKTGCVVTEGSRYDSGFDTHIYSNNLDNCFKLAKDIKNAEGNPDKMNSIVLDLMDKYNSYILDQYNKSDKKILEELY